MKKKVHPKYYKNVQVVCSCGNTFTIGGATVESINTDFCNKCHPGYTGERKVADTASKIKQFEAKQKISAQKQAEANKIKETRAKKTKTVKEASQKGEVTLKDILKEMSKKS